MEQRVLQVIDAAYQCRWNTSKCLAFCGALSFCLRVKKRQQLGNLRRCGGFVKGNTQRILTDTSQVEASLFCLAEKGGLMFAHVHT